MARDWSQSLEICAHFYYVVLALTFSKYKFDFPEIRNTFTDLPIHLRSVYQQQLPAGCLMFPFVVTANNQIACAPESKRLKLPSDKDSHSAVESTTRFSNHPTGSDDIQSYKSSSPLPFSAKEKFAGITIPLYRKARVILLINIIF